MTTRAIKRGVVALVAVLGALAALGWAGLRTLRYSGPHAVMRPHATLSPALVERVVAKVREAPPRKMSTAIEQALALTGEVLTFEAGHAPSPAFDVTPRPASEAEYAHLFGGVLDTVLHTLRIRARVWVVHSADTRVLGLPVSLGGRPGRTWVYIEEPREPGPWNLYYVDPLLHALTGTWRVAEHVEGPLTVLGSQQAQAL